MDWNINDVTKVYVYTTVKEKRHHAKTGRGTFREACKHKGSAYQVLSSYFSCSFGGEYKSAS